MSSYKTFSLNQIRNMNNEQPWNGSIKILPNSKHDCGYKLVATGDATTQQGRIYIAIPANMVITENMKSEMNLLI